MSKNSFLRDRNMDNIVLLRSTGEVTSPIHGATAGQCSPPTKGAD